MTIVRHLRARRVAPIVKSRHAFYGRNWTDGEREAWQLDQINRIWQAAAANLPFYRRLQREGGLPESFASINEFQTSLPVMDRDAVRAHLGALVDASREADGVRITGGS